MRINLLYTSDTKGVLTFVTFFWILSSLFLFKVLEKLTVLNLRLCSLQYYTTYIWISYTGFQHSILPNILSQKARKAMKTCSGKIMKSEKS